MMTRERNDKKWLEKMRYGSLKEKKYMKFGVKDQFFTFIVLLSNKNISKDIFFSK